MPKVKRPKKPKRKRIDPNDFRKDAEREDLALPAFELQNVVATFNLGVGHLD